MSIYDKNYKNTKIITDSTEVKIRLIELGTNHDIIVETVQEAFIARRNINKKYARPSAPGLRAFDHTVEGFREKNSLIKSEDWVKGDINNIATIISPKRKLKFAISSGDEYTGNSQRNSSTKYDKGEAFSAMVNKSNQLDFFSLTNVSLPEEPYKLYILLIHITNDKILVELSSPRHTYPKSKINDWQERLIIHVPLPGENNVDITPIEINPEVSNNL